MFQIHYSVTSKISSNTQGFHGDIIQSSITSDDFPYHQTGDYTNDPFFKFINVSGSESEDSEIERQHIKEDTSRKLKQDDSKKSRREEFEKSKKEDLDKARGGGRRVATEKREQGLPRTGAGRWGLLTNELLMKRGADQPRKIIHVKQTLI